MAAPNSFSGATVALAPLALISEVRVVQVEVPEPNAIDLAFPLAGTPRTLQFALPTLQLVNVPLLNVPRLNIPKVLAKAPTKASSKIPAKTAAKKKKRTAKAPSLAPVSTTSPVSSTSTLSQLSPTESSFPGASPTSTISTPSTLNTGPGSPEPVSTTTVPAPSTVAAAIPTSPTSPTLPTLVQGATPTRLPSRRKLEPTAELPADLTPAEYVDVVVGWAERYSVRRRQVDMPGLRARVEAITANATTFAETYPALQLYLEALGDNHSFLYSPAAAKVLLTGKGKSFGFQLVDQVVFPLAGSPALLAGMRDRDRLIAVNGEPYAKTMRISTIPDTSTFTVQHAGEATPVVLTVTRGDVKTSQLPTVKALDDRLGFVDLPGSTGTNADEGQFTAAGQIGIRRVDESSPRCGWVLDLRRNSGGFPYSMLAAIALLYGNAELGGTVDVDGNLSKLSTFNGALRINGITTFAAAGYPSLSQPNGPIAILTSSSTASAAELAMVGFVGRPGVRVFGDATFGVPSGNVGRAYPDGSFLAVTNTLDVDRFGRSYSAPLLPDEPVVMDWSLFGTPSDPVLAAASRWARAQPACSVLGP